MNESKVAITVSKTVSIIQLVAGIVMLLFFGPSTILCVTDRELLAMTGAGFVFFFLLLDALAVWLIILSRKNAKLLKEFKRYVAAVSSIPTGFIPDIAAALGTSVDVVRKNLDLMIKKRFFANAFIDLNTNCIVIVHNQNTEDNAAQQSNAAASSQSAEMMTVKCKGCGGINTIRKGTAAECDYCGSSIKAE